MLRGPLRKQQSRDHLKSAYKMILASRRCRSIISLNAGFIICNQNSFLIQEGFSSKKWIGSEGLSPPIPMCQHAKSVLHRQRSFEEKIRRNKVIADSTQSSIQPKSRMNTKTPCLYLRRHCRQGCAPIGSITLFQISGGGEEGQQGPLF